MADGGERQERSPRDLKPRARARPLSPLANLDHFGDLNEMILDALTTVETRGSDLLNDLFKIAVIRVPEHLREVAARPD
jgi:hypothetical protein